MKCQNDGYLSVIKEKCKCRCPEGLDYATGCTTIYQGGELQIQIIGSVLQSTHCSGTTDEMKCISKRPSSAVELTLV